VQTSCTWPVCQAWEEHSTQFFSLFQLQYSLLLTISAAIQLAQKGPGGV
jgi:steroid 5-alpha reductase family enzyme